VALIERPVASAAEVDRALIILLFTFKGVATPAAEMPVTAPAVEVKEVIIFPEIADKVEAPDEP